MLGLSLRNNEVIVLEVDGEVLAEIYCLFRQKDKRKISIRAPKKVGIYRRGIRKGEFDG